MPEHPWQLTLRQLIDTVRRDYGPDAARGLERLAELRADILDDPLEEDVLRGLIVRAGLPLADFGFDDDTSVAG